MIITTIDENKVCAAIGIGLFFAVLLVCRVSSNSANSSLVIQTNSGLVPSTSNLTSEPLSNISRLLLPGNFARTDFRVVNESNQTGYLAYGPTASLTDYTSILLANAEHPGQPGYIGPVSMILQTDIGTARVTELTKA